MIHTRGEDYLRLTHCEKEELTADWEIDVTNELLQNLRNNLQKDIHTSTRHWRTMSQEYCSFEGVSMHYVKKVDSPKVS